MADFFVAIFESDSKEDVVEDLIYVLFIYALAVVHNFNHTLDIYIFILGLNIRRYLIELFHERAFE